MSASSDFITTIINNAIDVANQQTEAAGTFAQTAMTAASAVAVTNPPAIDTTITVPNVVVDIPQSALGPNVGLYNSTFAEIQNMLTTQFVSFFTTYFPASVDYVEDAQEWLDKVFDQGGTGIAPAAEDQIYQRDRARVLAEGQRVQEEVLTTWAARSFPLPPGAATYNVLQAKQTQQDLIGKSSRDIAIKQAEIEVENVRFAVQQSLAYRIGAVQAAAEYIKTLALGPQIASQMSIAAVNAQSNLINAASNYFRARLEVEALKLDARKTTGTLQLQGQGIDVQAFTARSSNLAHAASAAAAAAGQMAAAALNALHSQATLESIENV